MCLLRIAMFGKFCVWIDQQPVEGLQASKVQELFCYLLLNRGRLHLRETLAGTLWGDSSIAQSKKYLRQALWQLQTTLDEHAAASDAACGDSADSTCLDALLISDSNWIGLNEAVPLWLDVAAFEEAFAQVRGQAGEALTPAEVTALSDAVALYQGDLLEGCYHEWFWYDRERLQNMYLTMLDKLMAYHAAQGNTEQGVEYGGRILRLDRARECTHQQLMVLYARAGQRSAALRQYARCEAALDEELGVAPSERTRTLYHEVCADAIAVQAPVTVVTADLPHAPSAGLSDVLGRLEQLWTVLADLQRQVEHEIHSVNQTLSNRL